MFIHKFWNTLSNIGTIPIGNDRLKRKIILCNRLAFTVGLLPILTSIYLYLNLHSKPYFISPLIIGFFYLLTILLNKLNLTTFSRIYITILPTINLMIVSGVLGEDVSLAIKFPYLSIIVGPMVLFDLTEKKFLIFGVLWVVCMYYLTDIVNPRIPLLPDHDPQFINSLQMINFCSFLSFTIFIAGYWYLQHINFKAEERIYSLLKETNTQKIEIEVIHKTLTDSIHYAKSIQTAALPKQEIIKPFCNESFLLYKPKDIISGDFYMFYVYYNQLIISVADCTGHGIPGAMMSMLGISFLNQTLHKTGLKKSDEILFTLRNLVKTSLKQSDLESTANDGIDMSIVVIDMDTLKAQFSGANRPILMIKESDPKTIIEFKPDKNPVGIFSKETSFTSHDFQLSKGDTLYFYTDGFEDQIGSDHTTKYKHKNFKNLLLGIQNHHLSEQQNIIEKTLINWRGDEPQTDDILIFGIKI